MVLLAYNPHVMYESIVKLAIEQSFPIALLVVISTVLWKTFRKDSLRKERRIEALENEFKSAQQKYADDMLRQMAAHQEKYGEIMKLMQHTTTVLEHNTLVLEKYLPEAKLLSHLHR